MESSGDKMPTFGYWKIRGLAAPIRMMLHYKQQPYKQVSYGEDATTEWFTGDKPKLQEKNSLANLPYMIDADGDTVICQSKSIMVYWGLKLGIDAPEHMARNHQVLDRVEAVLGLLRR